MRYIPTCPHCLPHQCCTQVSVAVPDSRRGARKVCIAIQSTKKEGAFFPQSSCLLFPSRFPPLPHPRMPPTPDPEEHTETSTPVDLALDDFVLKSTLLILGILYCTTSSTAVAPGSSLRKSLTTGRSARCIVSISSPAGHPTTLLTGRFSASCPTSAMLSISHQTVDCHPA